MNWDINRWRSLCPLVSWSAQAFLPTAIDVSVEPLDVDKVARARFVGIAVPMHTALRLGVYVVKRIREINPEAIICLYGLYAGLNADYLLKNGVDFCIAGEYESPLLALIEMVGKGQVPLAGKCVKSTRRGDWQLRRSPTISQTVVLLATIA